MNNLITAEELASKLRVRPSTVKTWTVQRLIPAIRITGKTIRFDFDEVRAALEAKSTEVARRARDVG